MFILIISVDIFFLYDMSLLMNYSSEKIKLKAYMEYRRHAKLEFVSPKPVNKRGGVSRPVFSDSSDGVVVDDVVLNYE